MKNSTMLFLVKFVHTIIWIGYNLILAYLFYAVATENLDWKFWLGILLIGIECLVLFFNNWVCPLSPIARRYTASTKANFDIYIPEWIARHNITIYSIFFGVLILFFLIKMI